MPCYLVGTSEQQKGVRILLLPEGEMVIGRSFDCYLSLKDTNMARHHCQIARREGVYYLEDLGSSNGTYANSIRLSMSYRLRHGDRIQIGNSEFVFESEENLPEEKSAPLTDGQETEIGDYRILRRLGGGTMGEVFQAQHKDSGQLVAIKLLYANRGSIIDARRFVQEAQAGMKLDHPHIAKVSEFGVREDDLFLVMDYVDGLTLEQHVAQYGPFAPRPALRLIAQAAQAVHYAHSWGIVHRDLKPANILIERQTQQVKIIDFGIAKLSMRTMTMDYQPLGTLRYSSPEQIMDAKSVDHRTDIYALGATLYFLLSGKAPYFEVGGMASLVFTVTSTPPKPLAQLISLPPTVSALVEKTMARQKEDRFESAQVFLQAVRQIDADL